MPKLKIEKALTAERKKQRIETYLKAIEKNECKDLRGKKGTFLIYGDNQEQGDGHKFTPLLAVMKGRFEDVLSRAVELKGFCFWSDHRVGKIEKVAVVSV